MINVATGTKRPQLKTVVAGLILAGLLASTLAACAETDVVAKYAASSFATVSARLNVSQTAGGLAFVSPAGDRFELGADLSAEWDALLSTAAEPFLAAGLDPARLPVGPGSRWTIEGDRLVGRFKLADSGKAKAGEASALIQALAAASRARIGYHAQGKHYGIMLDEFAMVEWAANPDENAKDWILVLSPELVNNSGGQAAAVAGWTLAMVPVDGPDGKMTEVEKLLKAVDLPK